MCANFFSYVCNSKIIKEMLAPTLNRIAVRVKCVSSTAVVVNAELLDRLRREQTKKTVGKRGTFLAWSNNERETSYSFHHASDNRSIIYFNNLRKPIEI